ncbi:MAG: sigma factor, partial [Burkholderiaceae bacterium]
MADARRAPPLRAAGRLRPGDLRRSRRRAGDGAPGRRRRRPRRRQRCPSRPGTRRPVARRGGTVRRLVKIFSAAASQAARLERHGGTMDNATLTFHRLRPRLQGIAYRMLGSLAEAEEVVQDVWLRWNDATRDAL